MVPFPKDVIGMQNTIFPQTEIIAMRQGCWNAPSLSTACWWAHEFDGISCLRGSHEMAPEGSPGRKGLDVGALLHTVQRGGSLDRIPARDGGVFWAMWRVVLAIAAWVAMPVVAMMKRRVTNACTMTLPSSNEVAIARCS